MKGKAKISGSVAAGFPSPAEQYSEGALDLNDLLVKRPAATFFVRVQGDSMTGRGINDGDLLVVDRSLEPASGDVVIACVDGEFTVKTLRMGARGAGVRLEAANPKYPAIVLRQGQELDYFGKVTACIHRF
ncbi:MAG: translesion error-prone DNA polymerase V autoproteolytic subunit [Kiritimatiellae bacterium]|nr:translesion error-prone DNA polymerase V autoproteolytic subunit [Kiritimatiellia bacterium]